MTDSTLQRPHVIKVPGGTVRVLVIHQGVAYDPPERLAAVREFKAAGPSVWIAAAQAQNGCWGYIDECARWIVAPTFADARIFSADNLARFKVDDLWGYVNASGDIVIAAQYADALAFSHGLAAVQVAQNQWRYINVRGEFAFADTFLRAAAFSACGLAAACKKRQNKIGYIRQSGEWAIKPQFNSWLAFGDDGVAPASLDGDRYGLIDALGQWVLAPKYPTINGFNDDGLAYYDEEDSWTNGHGYLNSRGECVIKGDRHLAKVMVGGVVATDYKGSSYLRKDGKPLCDRRFSWGSHFSALGFAVVRTPDCQWSEALARHVDEVACWGLLRADGTFLPTATDLLEPLTNADGWVTRADISTPFAAFVGKDGHIAWLDGNGHPIYRLRYSAAMAASFYDAAGNCLWTSTSSDASDTFASPEPFFNPPVARFLDKLDSAENVVAFARTMLTDTEARTHAFARGEPLPESGADDDDDEDDESNDGEEDVEVTAVRRRLLRAYVDEGHNGAYEFLSTTYSGQVSQVVETLRERLTEAFGAPDPDPEATALQAAYAASMSAWSITMQQALSATDGSGAAPLVESSQLWLGLYESSDSGDGDAWQEVWLLCAPSVDVLQEAMRLRMAGSGKATTNSDASAAGDDAPQLPTNYEQWLQAVRSDKHAIAHVPSSLLDEALVAAAITADTEALQYVPPRYQTAERLAALVRRDVATALNVPPQCMTAEALSLARSLYEEDADWSWRDQRNGKLPDQWTKNCLYDVWGGLLSEDDCVKAVKGGESLQCVPHWLRSQRVERVALDADIYNIRHIAPEEITAELAARAVRHDYGQLVEVIPLVLLTPELCLSSARINGLSLEHIPDQFKSVDVCAAAIKDDARAFVHVPDAIRVQVCTELIDTARSQLDQVDVAAQPTRWHSYRAWSRLWQRDFDGAIADATVAVEYLEHPVHAHYVRASAYRELGRTREAALQAAVVLAVTNPYRAEFDDEDTTWLHDMALGAMADSDDAALLDALREHPLALARVPRARVTQAMVEFAVAANPAAVEHVPKRLMTPALYVSAVEQRCKQFAHIPLHQLSEAACVNEVSHQGYALERIPSEWRTLAVCAAAVRDNPRAIEHVPETMREDVLRAAADVPKAIDVAADGANTRSALDTWLQQKAMAHVMSARGEESTFKKARSKFLLFAWIFKGALIAQSNIPAAHSGVVGWLARRPFAALMINALIALIALTGHGFVVVSVWRTEGAWIGVATAILMGIAELYWAWRFLFTESANVLLGAISVFVALYVLVYRRVHARAARVMAAHRIE